MLALVSIGPKGLDDFINRSNDASDCSDYMNQQDEPSGWSRWYSHFAPSQLAAQTVLRREKIPVVFWRTRPGLIHGLKLPRNSPKSKLAGTPRRAVGVARASTLAGSGGVSPPVSANCYFSSFFGNSAAISPIVWPGCSLPQAASENLSAAPPRPSCA